MVIVSTIFHSMYVLLLLFDLRDDYNANKAERPHDASLSSVAH